MSVTSRWKAVYLDPPSEKDAARFWKHVKVGDIDACWPWQGAQNHHGYGLVKRKINGLRRAIPAHRYARAIQDRGIAEGILVLHQCDVRYMQGDIRYRTCCNPAHLRLGTHKENTRECIERGRIGKHGISHGTMGLTLAQVRSIRESAAYGQPTPLLAQLYGVEPSIIDALLRERAS